MSGFKQKIVMEGEATYYDEYVAAHVRVTIEHIDVETERN